MRETGWAMVARASLAGAVAQAAAVCTASLTPGVVVVAATHSGRHMHVVQQLGAIGVGRSGCGLGGCWVGGRRAHTAASGAAAASVQAQGGGPWSASTSAPMFSIGARGRAAGGGAGGVGVGGGGGSVGLGWWAGRGGAPCSGRDERCGSSRPLPGGSWGHEE